jgi:hypothetical protein
MVLPQALPASLRVLQAFRVPVDVLARLTALESLTLDDTIGGAAEAGCGLSALQQLTRLRLGGAADAEMRLIDGCTGLRTLCLRSARLPRLELHVSYVHCPASSMHCPLLA